MRRIFSTVLGPHEPALTVGSLAISATGRPAIVPMPVTTPSAPSPSASQLASSASSVKEPSSSRRADALAHRQLALLPGLLVVALGPAGVGAVEGVLDVLGVGHGRGGESSRTRSTVSSSVREASGTLAGVVGARLGRQRAARAQAGEHHAEAEQQEQQRPVEQRVVVADRPRRRGRRGGWRRRGRRARARGRPRRRRSGRSRRRARSAPSRRAARSAARRRTAATAPSTAGTTPGQRERQHREPGRVDHLLGVARRRPAQQQRDEGVAEREQGQQPAVRGRRGRVERPSRRTTARRPRARAPRSARRSRSCAPPPATARRRRTAATSRRTRRRSRPR